MSEPIYKDVLGYPNYEVSLDGLIRRKNTPFRGAKILRQCLNSVNGYNYVGLFYPFILINCYLFRRHFVDV